MVFFSRLCQRRYTHAKDLLKRAKRKEREEKERKERESRQNGEARRDEKADKKRRLKLAQEREVSTPVASKEKSYPTSGLDPPPSVRSKSVVHFDRLTLPARHDFPGSRKSKG